ncbi:MAG: T9SS-dependent M36 family metallopeptidase, partial [Phaeodactylibacter sp.]|nr:T9SS-dependent M36 family metallopeptidase [Phaeodactylibacter sp.]
MKNTFYLCLSILMILFLAVPVCLSGQQNKQLVDDYLQGQENTLGLTEADISGLRVTDEYTNRKNGIIYIYLQQTLNGIDLRGATANGVIKEGRVYRLNADRLIANAESRTAAKAPMLNALAAVQKVAGEVGLVLPGQLSILELEQTPDQATSIDPGQFALEPVTAKLVYNVDREETFRLAWEVQLYEKNAQHHWLVRVDALNGAILFKKDQVLHCDFGHPAHLHAAGSCQGEISPASTPAFPENLLLGGSYLVFPQPVESPNHGDQALVTDVENLVASPYGWHDTDAIPGPEFTITRGNNVHAYDDVDDDNASNGLEPDGGADLLFNYPFDPGGSEADVREAAIVNLFFWCNLMHDVWYQYGFDEVAGNFQVNNYGNGGEEGDPIRAEAQDGSGTNNANFNSGGDGSGARIQMYLWTSGGGNAPNLLTVNTPGSIAGTYGAEEAIFGPGLPADPLTGDLILVNDGSFNPTLGCFDLSNGNEIEGKIALVDRGLCSFVQKVQNAQDVGAIAVIVCNDEGGNPFQMGGDGPDITIPSVMISEDDCMLIKTEISSGVNVTLDASGGGGVADFKDGDFDSGIISHEYGHGLSIRMTGGPSVGNCLFNDEQMGEGWSDYATLMMTMEEGDQPGDIRGVGTYALNEPIDGVGIRPAPYSTDFGINDYTYGNTNGGSLSQPHGIGFVWCTMLWDLTWALIDEYGFDPDIYNGTGGNNIAMHLVTEGMKLQACTPGFVDGRDGILLADELFYNSQNRCIIWEAFAKRGLGFSAYQGSSNDRNDQVEAFDLAPWCLDPEFPPIAGFLVDVTENCFGVFNFTNTSSEVPQSWLWDFGDGNT